MATANCGHGYTNVMVNIRPFERNMSSLKFRGANGISVLYTNNLTIQDKVCNKKLPIIASDILETSELLHESSKPVQELLGLFLKISIPMPALRRTLDPM